MRSLIGSLIVFFVLVFQGCGGSNATTKESDVSSRDIADNMEYVILHQGFLPVDMMEYMQGKAGFFSFDSANKKEMDNFYKMLSTLVPNVEERDFDGMLLIAKMGVRPTGGYGFAVESIQDMGSHVEVVLNRITPKDIATMGLTNPFMVLYLPNIHKEVKFIER